MKHLIRRWLGMNATELYHAREMTRIAREMVKLERRVQDTEDMLRTSLYHLVAILERRVVEEETPCPCQTRGDIDWTETSTEG